MSKFQFQVSKSVHGDGGLPGAVAETLNQFQPQCVLNLKRGEATLLTTVTAPEDGVYFGIVLAGPFDSLESLKAALDTIAQQPLIEQMKKLGIE